MIPPEGSKNKVILENSQFDVFVFQREVTDTVNSFSQTALTLLFPLWILRNSTSFFKFISIQLKLKKTSTFLILSLADLSMR